MIRDKLNSVRERIRKSAERSGRKASDIVLVCVAKEASAEEAEEAVRAGATDIGENRVRDAAGKQERLGKYRAVRWHFIGHLQTNKVKKAVEIFDLIHSIDSLRLAGAVQKEAEKAGKMQSVLAEVNISGEKNKYGLPPEDAISLIEEVKKMENIMLLGLMAMAPYSPAPEAARPYFRRLKRLRDELSSHNCANIDMRHLSMGMSGDFEVAIEEGADIVRIGSAIFK